MIQANELRIGNWLERLDGTFFQVSYSTYQDFYIYPEYLLPKPTPLTEEWLVKFEAEVYEFDNGQSNQYRIKDDLFVIRDGIICHYGTSVKLEYVHKLQNLYFALRGQELTIKN